LISSGGQAIAQEPLQFDLGGLDESPSKTYRVRPAPSVRYVPIWAFWVALSSTVWLPLAFSAGG
jgi:hypothetical protein